MIYDCEGSRFIAVVVIHLIQFAPAAPKPIRICNPISAEVEKRDFFAGRKSLVVLIKLAPNLGLGLDRQLVSIDSRIGQR